jgi:hypothetical protein
MIIRNQNNKMAANFAAICIFFLSVIAQPVFSQPMFHDTSFNSPRETLLVDFDGDHIQDRFQVFSLNDYFDVLTFDKGVITGQQDEFDVDSAYILPANLSDFETVQKLPNGSISLGWGCFACGRNHSHYSVTIALKNDQLTVIGYDQTIIDRIYAAALTCSINYLTGKVVIEAIDVEKVKLKTNELPQPLQLYPFEMAPTACGGLAKYDDDFLTKHFPSE